MTTSASNLLPWARVTTLEQLEAERLKVQAALAEADRQAVAGRMRDVRFRAVADFTHDWELWLAPDGAIIYTSPSCERVTGYSPQELTAHPNLLEAMVHPDDRTRVRERYVAPHSETMEPFEYRIVTKTGGVRWIGLSSQPVTDDHGNYLGRRTSNRDITAHMRTVEALREADHRLRLALHKARVTIYAVDKEQRYTWFQNPAANTSTDGHASIGKTSSEAFPSAGLEPVVEARRQVVETGSGLRAEFSVVVDGKPGTYEYTIEPLRDDAGEVTGALVAAVDITERRQAEDEIRELSQRLSFPRRPLSPGGDRVGAGHADQSLVG